MDYSASPTSPAAAADTQDAICDDIKTKYSIAVAAQIEESRRRRRSDYAKCCRSCGLPLITHTVKCLQTSRNHQQILSVDDDIEFDKLAKTRYHRFALIYRCHHIFQIVPEDYEFEEDTLIQLLMAGDNFNGDQLKGQICFHSLLEAGFLLHSGTNFVKGKKKYRINLTKSGSRSFDCLKWVSKCQNYNITKPAKIQHISLLFNGIDATIFQTLQQFSKLRTLLFLHGYCNRVVQIPDQMFQSLNKLQALDLSGTHIRKLSSSVGCMINLRYLDLSWTPIEWLPDTICSLTELQTLKLKGCSKLRELPRQLKRLTKLQYIDVDILRQFAAVPRGIGALRNLRTLSAFLVGTEDGCKIQELEKLNCLSGDFCIAMLENVGNGDEAKEAALSNKKYLDKLELRWTASQLLRTNNNCYDVLKELKPCPSLKELRIFCYEGCTFPDWIGDPRFTQLVSITFFNCEHVSKLPCVEQLPLLRHLELIKMNGVKRIESEGKGTAFFSLERLEIDEMQSLRAWNWVRKTEGDFCSFVQLTINDCPELQEFDVFPCLSSIKHLEVKGCPKLESLSETKLPDSLQDLIVEDCPRIKKKCSQPGREDWYKIQHVSKISIYGDDDYDDHDEE